MRPGVLVVSARRALGFVTLARRRRRGVGTVGTWRQPGGRWAASVRWPWFLVLGLRGAPWWIWPCADLVGLVSLALGVAGLSAGSELGCPFDDQPAGLVGGVGRFGFEMTPYRGCRITPDRGVSRPSLDLKPASRWSVDRDFGGPVAFRWRNGHARRQLSDSFYRTRNPPRSWNDARAGGRGRGRGVANGGEGSATGGSAGAVPRTGGVSPGRRPSPRPPRPR
jgi:hypothetical protein